MSDKNIFYLLLFLLGIYSFPSTGNTKRGLEEKNNKDIIIIHTNDVHCGVQDNIGYDGLMLYKKQLEKKYENIIIADVGDHIQGGILGTITDGESIIDIMNEIGYDVATLGNHEFDYGIQQLDKLKNQLKCSYISANYCLRKDKPKSIYPPYKIIEKGGKKIGFIGVTTPQTLTKAKAFVTTKDENGKNFYDFLTENNSKELYSHIQNIINELKNDEKVDYIILLTHLGIGGDALEENTSAGLLKNIKNVDAILDGHSHLIYSEKYPDVENKDTTLAQTGTKLKAIGVLRIDENGIINQENIEKVPYDPNLANETLNITRSKVERYVDKSMYEYINNIFENFEDLLNDLLGTVDFPLNTYRSPADKDDSNNQLSRRQENPLCNLVADSLRIAGDADISIINAGTIRNDINQGNITFQNIVDVMPYSNDIYVKEIKGQTILDALEFGVKSLPEPTSRFPQVSGLKFKIDISIESTVEVDENEEFIKVKGERRVYDVKVNGEKIDSNKIYTICSHSFILSGGDQYSMFKDFEIKKEGFGVDNEILMDFIEYDLKGVIPERYKNPEGRYIMTNGKQYDPEDTKLDFVYLFGFGNFKYEENKNASGKVYFIGTTKGLKNLKKYINFTIDITYENSNNKETIFAIGERNEVYFDDGKITYSINYPNTEGKKIKKIKTLNDYKFSDNKTNIIVENKNIIISKDFNLTNSEEIQINFIKNITSRPRVIDGSSFGFEFEYDNSNLTDNLETKMEYLDENNLNKSEFINCKYIKKTTNNNNLICYPKKNMKSNMKTWNFKIPKISSLNKNLRILNDESLLICMDPNNVYEDMNFTYSPTHFVHKHKNNKGLSAGAIVAIILSCLIVVATVVIVWYFYIRKTKYTINGKKMVTRTESETNINSN